MRRRDQVRSSTNRLPFYRARAPEYDQSWVTRQELETVKQSLRKLGAFAEVVELACGRGLWTEELIHIGNSVTAIDASPEMIDLNRQRVGSDRVIYQHEDLFQWEPDTQYDLLFGGFWLSHVPPDRIDDFLNKVRRAVRPHGTVFFVDQCNDIPDDAQGETEGILQRRRVADGREFTIVKVYYHPVLLGLALGRLGFAVDAQRVGESFFTIVGRRKSG